MSWNISGWSIRNPVPTIVLFLVLVGAGIASFFYLGIDEEPNLDVPIVSVTITQLGAAPVELESQVTRRVEDAVAGIHEVKHILSKVGDGVSQTNIEFQLGTNIARAVNDVRNAVSKVRRQLPQDVDEPVIQEVAVLGGPFATYAVSADHHSMVELSWLVDHDIARSLLSIPGVGQVERIGGLSREVRINLDPVRLQAMEISADMVNSQVRALNLNSPGGRGELGSSEQSIRTLGSALTTDQLAATPISLPNGRFAPLNSLGTITDDAGEQRQLALLNGRPVVAFSISRSTGSNLVQVEEAVDERITHLSQLLPSDVRLQKVKTTAEFVRKSYDLSWESLFLGAAAAVTVIWLVLKDARAAGIAALALPLSVIPTFLAIKAAGFTLNNMTLLALALVTGILVDDAIVEIENIVRHMGKGKTAFQAALDGADEIGLAVVATTMTLVVVFLPVAFMAGLPGQFFKPFGLTIAVAVLFSLLVARMITPLMCAYWLRPMEHAVTPIRVIRAYKRSLSWALRHRITVVVVALSLFGGSLLMLTLVPTSLIGDEDREESLLTVELPPGSMLEDTRRVCEQIVQRLRAHPEVTAVLATIGTPGQSQLGAVGNQGGVNRADIDLILKPRNERSVVQDAFERGLRSELSTIPGARISLGRVDSIIPGKPLQIVFTSDDPSALSHTANDMLTQMRSRGIFTDVTSSDAPLRPEIIIRPDFDPAARHGVSVQTIARTALIATVGDIDANLAKFNLPGRQINVRVQLEPGSRQDVQTITNLRVAGTGGRLLPLSSVATVEYGYGNSQIDRYDRDRQITIESNLGVGVSLGEALQEVQRLPAFRNLSPGVHFQLAGDAEKQQEVFSAFSYTTAIGIPLVYAVLALLFGEFLHPLTIMMSLPLSLCGALIGLTVCGKDVGLYALIGIVMLVGLVTKNATLLIEYTQAAMRRGTPRIRALVTAGAVRMRPILMTTGAMIVGMIPIAVATGAGAEVRSPMAIALIGGLISSSLLTLVVIPVVFTYVEDFKHWIVHLSGFGRKRRESEIARAEPQVSYRTQQH